MRFICAIAVIFCVSITSGLGDENTADAAETKSGGCAGCEFVVNQNKLQYRDMAGKALMKYIQHHGFKKPYRVLQVKKATEQIVAGLITRITFTASPIIQCPPEGVLSPYWFAALECHSETFQQHWTNSENIKISCKPLLQTPATVEQ